MPEAGARLIVRSLTDCQSALMSASPPQHLPLERTHHGRACTVHVTKRIRPNKAVFSASTERRSISDLLGRLALLRTIAASLHALHPLGLVLKRGKKA
jgi:hypothetical protein